MDARAFILARWLPFARSSASRRRSSALNRSADEVGAPLIRFRKTASMRSSVPAGSRAGVKSSLMRGRPISLKLLISLIDKPE